MEIWRYIEGYEGLYQVSNMGRIKSLKFGKEKILKSCKGSGGYLYLVLCKDGKNKPYLVHRLVASAFLNNPNNLPQINHIDEDKTNNKVENLEYCDAKYNMNYGSRIERMSKSLSTPILQFTKDGKFVRKWDSSMQVERELGINNSNISKCCKRKLKSAGGYLWMYAKVGVFEIDVNKLKKAA